MPPPGAFLPDVSLVGRAKLVASVATEQAAPPPKTPFLGSHAARLLAQTINAEFYYLFPFSALQFVVDSCVGIPLPEVRYRSHIKARRVRVCMFDGPKAIGNVFTFKADWDPKEEVHCLARPNASC